jgi:hypothetical protein
VHPFYNLFSTAEQFFVLAVWAPEPFYLLLALEYHSMYRFPPTVSRGRFWSVLQVLFYLVYAGFLLRSWLAGRSELPIPDAIIHFYPGRAVYSPVTSGLRELVANLYGLAALLAIFAVIARNYRLAENAGQRRRMRWIIFGFAAGLSPYTVVLVLQFIGQTAGIAWLQRGPQWASIIWALNAWMAIIPVCFAYAVARHRLFDISLIIRRGLQYLLARRMLQALLLMPAVALALSVAANPSRTVAQLLFEGSGVVNLALLAATAASLRYREKLRTWLDRRFFRQAYNSEAILMTLPERLRDLRSPAEVAAKVAEDVIAALHPRAAYVLSWQGASAAFSTIYTSDSSPVILKGSEHGWQSSSHPVSELRHRIEVQTLEERGVQLVVPLLSGRNLQGLLLLAERKSEEPYSSRDRALLEAIAAQAAVLLQKFRLEEELHRQQHQVRQMAVRLGDEIANLCRQCPECGACYDGSATSCTNDGQVPVVVLPVDRTIHARYRLDRLVGKGGMGAVYQATDILLKREVAVKIMLNDLFGNDKALQRFQREAEISARLVHPSIVRIYDFGGVGAAGAYLVMEFLKGITARQALAERGLIRPVTVAQWMDQLLAGIEWAHAAGVVHRDLKPENLLLIEEQGSERIKILDFGLAKVKLLQIAEAEQLTVPGVTMGTVGYMSPEQVAGGDVDQRADIYAVGTIVFEMLTGNLPGDDEDLEEALAENLAGDIGQLAAALRSTRARNRAERPASAAELRATLMRALDSVRPSGFVVDAAALFKCLGVDAPEHSRTPAKGGQAAEKSAGDAVAD